MNKHEIIALIPARGGSKGVPGKNIRNLGGYPLISYSICAASLTKSIDRTIVSTDSKEIADIALRYGAEVPFLRPSEISGDNSTDLELFNHAINWLKENEGMIPEFIIHLRPTTPLRDPSQTSLAIESIKKRQDATSLRSAHHFFQPPQKMFQVDEKGFFKGFFPNDPRPEYYNLPRQTFSKAFCPNGYVDIIRPEFVQKNHALHGSNILAFITPTVGEVDKPEDFEYLEYILNKFGNITYKYLKENFPNEKAKNK
ncbi:MAG: acylneuraminate cytidylyltransferase family protein [Elusimicrobia bacterium]|nr:acylneuraminate cytidylyltransferase family protein [Candidatus Liberimonas magnetica]